MFNEYILCPKDCQKELPIKGLLECFLLYWVLFLPGITVTTTVVEYISFDFSTELTRIFFYELPALALVLYLLVQNLSSKKKLYLKPRRKDLMWAMISFVILIALAWCVNGISSIFTMDTAAVHIEAPQGWASWIVMPLTSLSTGYLEETYFRFYLLTRLQDSGIGTRKAIVLATLLFSLCHLYEGIWGVLNAALAGFTLSLIFLRSHSYHGLAWGHGAYNSLVFALGS